MKNQEVFMNRSIIVVILLVFCLAFIGCNHAFNPDLNKQDTTYLVRVKSMENGTVTAIPDSGVVGTEIKVIVNPAPGYRLETDSLQTIIIGSNRDTASTGTIKDFDMRFQMLAGGVVLSANFVPLTGNQRSVSLGETAHGYLIASPLFGPPATPVSITVMPDAGYALKDGSLKVNGAAVTGPPPYAFTLADANVTVTAEFEKKDAAGLVDAARKSMSAGQYELAFNYYEAAYQADMNNPEAIIYSALGKFTNILNVPQVRVLLKETGISTVPSNIDKWLDFSTGGRGWNRIYYDYYRYPDTEARNTDAEIVLPMMGSPQGFPMGFLNYPIYQTMNSMRYGPDREVFDVLLFWNIVGNHTQGLNDFLNDMLKYAFGAEFNEAAARIAKLDNSQTAPFNTTLRDAIKLDGVYADDAVIGKAELEMVLGSMYAVKAALEWLTSYDWETELSIIKVVVNYGDKINNIITTMLDTAMKDRLDHSSDFSPLGKILPFRNHFLQVRDTSLMIKAKADLQKAADLLAPAYDRCYDRFIPAARTKYQWMQGAQGMFPLLKSAIDSGGNFYLPEVPKYKSFIYAMDGKPQWVIAAEAKHGVNLGKLFVPGGLSIDKLVVTEKAGKAPVFYGFKSGSGNGTAVTYEETNIGQYETFSFALSPGFKEAFVKVNNVDTGGSNWLFELFPDTELTKPNGTRLYDLYQKR
jgi:hypothetical protein